MFKVGDRFKAKVRNKLTMSQTWKLTEIRGAVHYLELEGAKRKTIKLTTSDCIKRDYCKINYKNLAI